MGKPKVKKTLYFISGPLTSDEQRAEIENMPGNVCVRNVNMIHDNESLEDFDHVAGEVPTAYAEVAHKRALEKEGEPDAPKATAAAPGAPQNARAKAGAPQPASAWKAN